MVNRLLIRTFVHSVLSIVHSTLSIYLALCQHFFLRYPSGAFSLKIELLSRPCVSIPARMVSPTTGILFTSAVAQSAEPDSRSQPVPVLAVEDLVVEFATAAGTVRAG